MRKNLFLLIFIFICSTYYSSGAMKGDTTYIDKETVGKIESSLKKWLDFYELNIHNFKFQHRSHYLSSNDSTSMYYRKYTSEDDIYDPQLYDYSPDKRRYLDLMTTAGAYREEDGKCYYLGGDDCLEIYLTDRDKKEKNMIIWQGLGGFCEDVFWINNDIFAVVGEEHSIPEIRLFNLNTNSYNHYSYDTDINDNSRSYFKEVNLKERGIFTTQE